MKYLLFIVFIFIIINKMEIHSHLKHEFWFGNLTSYEYKKIKNLECEVLSIVFSKPNIFNIKTLELIISKNKKVNKSIYDKNGKLMNSIKLNYTGLKNETSIEKVLEDIKIILKNRIHNKN